MSHWDYRVVAKNGEFAIHEALYDDEGQLEGITEDPVFPRAESLGELREELMRYAAALEDPLLDYSEVASHGSS
jgi:hypothetical protein